MVREWQTEKEKVESGRDGDMHLWRDLIQTRHKHTMSRDRAHHAAHGVEGEQPRVDERQHGAGRQLVELEERQHPLVGRRGPEGRRRRRLRSRDGLPLGDQRKLAGVVKNGYVWCGENILGQKLWIRRFTCNRSKPAETELAV